MLCTTIESNRTDLSWRFWNGWKGEKYSCFISIFGLLGGFAPPALIVWLWIFVAVLLDDFVWNFFQICRSENSVDLMGRLITLQNRRHRGSRGKNSTKGKERTNSADSSTTEDSTAEMSTREPGAGLKVCSKITKRKIINIRKIIKIFENPRRKITFSRWMFDYDGKWNLDAVK